jgi:electron transfer flavoprotein alpha/beta subunit
MSDLGPLTIAVCLKVCPDTAQLTADPQTGAPRLDRAPRRISTFDEHALEEAVRLKEKHGGTVAAVSLTDTPPPPELILRTLAMGADSAYIIEDPTAGESDALATARILSAALRKLGDLDLVICGEGSLDAYERQVGPRLAEALESSVLTHVVQVEDLDGKLVAHRALEDRVEVLEVPTPAVLTVGQEINQPRFPTVLQIMSSASKPTVTWRLAELGFAAGDTAAGMAGVRTLAIVAPPEDRPGISIEGGDAAAVADKLAKILFERGLVKVE